MPPHLKVGKYVLKKTIGEGAFAEVRLAVHEDTSEEFAVKVFDRSKMPNADFERDIKREIKIMQYLRHPNIVSIHQVLVTSKKLYLVMELVRGGELYDEIVLKGRVDERTSRKYFHQIVDAMVYCHSRGVVHRDLKPENLLLDGNGNVKITDFGMSWMKDNIDPAVKAKQLLQTQCGTPKYMPPEIIVPSSKGYDGEKLDAWECGMVLYALLAGYLPFSGEDDNTVFRSILRGKVRFPNHFSPGAKDLLSRLLDKDPQRRSSLHDIRTHFWFLVDYQGEVDTGGASNAALKSAETGKGATGASEMKSGEVKKERSSLEADVGSSPKNCVDTKAIEESVQAQTPPDSGGEERENSSPITPRDQMIPKRTEPPPLKINQRDGLQSDVNLSKMPALRLDDVADDKEQAKANTSEATGHENVAEKASTVCEGRQVGSEDGVDEWNGNDLGFEGGERRGHEKVPELSLGDREDENIDVPMSLRDRLRTPLASMFKSLRSGAVAEEDGDGRSSWFSQASPSSVVETTRGGGGVPDEVAVTGVQGAMTLPFRKISRAFKK